jgi:hypothetical protein
MGGTNFHCEGKGKTADEAYSAAVQEALYWSGHGGYTGTIAEKSGFVVFTLPKGKDANWLERAISEYEFANDGATYPAWTGDRAEWAKREREYETAINAARAKTELAKTVGTQEAERMLVCYCDKWGPAVCVKTGPDTWVFFGIASC